MQKLDICIPVEGKEVVVYKIIFVEVQKGNECKAVLSQHENIACTQSLSVFVHSTAAKPG